jgi:hypothetical protein
VATPRVNRPRLSRRTPEQVERDARIVALRNRNFTFKQIAEQTGFASVSAAYTAYQRGLGDITQELPDERRKQLLERVDELSRAAWRVMHTTHFKVSAAGKVAVHPRTGEPLIDDGPVLDSIKVINLLMKTQRELEGTDAPTRTEVRHVDNFDADIADLVARMAAGGESPAVGHPEIFDVAAAGETGSATTER